MILRLLRFTADRSNEQTLVYVYEVVNGIVCGLIDTRDDQSSKYEKINDESLVAWFRALF